MLARWLLVLVVSAVAGSIFWQLPATFAGAVSAMGVTFWVRSFCMTVSVPTVELTYIRRPVMIRQRRDRFYAGWMDAVPQVRQPGLLPHRSLHPHSRSPLPPDPLDCALERRSRYPQPTPKVLVNLPILAVDALAMGVPVYWMVGFAPEAGRFFTFLLVLLLLNVAFDNFYRRARRALGHRQAGLVLPPAPQCVCGGWAHRPNRPPHTQAAGRDHAQPSCRDRYRRHGADHL